MHDIISKLLTRLTEPGTTERCGFVLSTGRVIAIKNIAEEPLRSFRMDPAQSLRWMSKPRTKVVATWHTHPGSDPNLSEEDYRGFLQWPDLQHHIIGLRDGKPAVTTYEVHSGIVVAV